MISKVITGSTFYGVCRYVCKHQHRAVVLNTEGVRDYDWKLMAADFERQHAMSPGLSKAVFHGIISFYPGEKITDKMMSRIAGEYLEKMGITDTQYAVIKHIDKEYLHLHIIANLVNNKGTTIRDKWIGLRGKKIAQELTLQYGLKQALSKDLSLTHLQALNLTETKRYIIYQTITKKLPQCRSLDELKNKLQQESGIETLYKYKGQTTELQGISFKLGEYKNKGSEVDRKFSINNLQKTLSQQAFMEMKQTSQTASHYQNSQLLKSKQQETTNPGSKETLAGMLLSPQEVYQPLPHQWKIKKKRKIQSKGLHL